MRGLSWTDRARIRWALLRVDYVLDARVPRGRRREIRNELRSNLMEAAGRVGAEAAVRQLGDLNELAKSYLEVYRGRWDFRAGSLAAVLMYAAIQVVGLAIFAGFSTGIFAGGGHSASYSFWNGFGPFGGNASTHSFGVLILSPAHLLLMAVAFVVGSAHRLILRR